MRQAIQTDEGVEEVLLRRVQAARMAQGQKGTEGMSIAIRILEAVLFWALLPVAALSYVCCIVGASWYLGQTLFESRHNARKKSKS